MGGGGVESAVRGRWGGRERREGERGAGERGKSGMRRKQKRRQKWKAEGGERERAARRRHALLVSVPPSSSLALLLRASPLHLSSNRSC